MVRRKGFPQRLMVLLFMLASSIPLVSQDTVYFDTANPPFMYGTNHSARGIYPSIIREIYKKLDKPVRCVSIPWVRALIEVKSTRSGIGGIYHTTDRDQYLDYSVSIYQERLVVYTLRNSASITSPEGLKDLKIGVIRGWSYGDEFDSLIRANQVVVEGNTSDELNFRKLIKRRLDAVIAVDISGDTVIEDLQIQDYVVKNPYSIYLDVYLAFNKSMDKADELTEINKIINQFRQDGTITRIIAAETKMQQ